MPGVEFQKNLINDQVLGMVRTPNGLSYRWESACIRFYVACLPKVTLCLVSFVIS